MLHAAADECTQLQLENYLFRLFKKNMKTDVASQRSGVTGKTVEKHEFVLVRMMMMMMSNLVNI